MKQRAVVYAPEARDDLLHFFDYLSGVAGPLIAINYVERLETFIEGLGSGSERGTVRNEVAKGLRVIGFEHRISIAFKVYEREVVIFRIFTGGQNWHDVLTED